MRVREQKQEDIGEIVNAIRKINNFIQCYSRELMRNFHITGPQLGVLRIVDSYPEVSLSELSQRMYLHISTISGIVERLELAGYLRRHRREDDKRTAFLELSIRGKRLIARTPMSGFGRMVQGLDKLPIGKLNEISRSMKKILDLMKIEDHNLDKFNEIIGDEKGHN